MLLWILVFSLLQSAEVPYKPIDEFEVKLDYQIKARPYFPQDADPKIDFRDSKDGLPDSRKKSPPAPHIAFNVKFLKLSDQEVRVRATNGEGFAVHQKKVKEGAVINLEMGFISDIKQGLVPNEFTILLLSPDKKPTDRIHIIIQRDGTYWVNEVQCGKF